MSFESFIKSPLHRFRDMQKNPDMYPVDYAEKAEIERMIKEDERKAKEDLAQTPHKEVVAQKAEVLTRAGADIENTVASLRCAGMLSEHEDNKVEAEIVYQRREQAINLLERVLDDAEKYLAQVSFLQLQKSADYEDPEKYQEAVGSSDTTRRTLHNKLITDVKMAMRLININFNADFPEDMRLREEAKMPDRQGIDAKKLQELMKQRQYFNFPYPAGVFIDFQKAPRDPIGEREFIANWAMKLYSDLTVLTNHIKHKE